MIGTSQFLLAISNPNSMKCLLILCLFFKLSLCLPTSSFELVDPICLVFVSSGFLSIFCAGQIFLHGGVVVDEGLCRLDHCWEDIQGRPKFPLVCPLMDSLVHLYRRI